MNQNNFIADINISPLTVSALKTSGYKIKRITDFLSPTASDEEIIELAIKYSSVIITQDLDFSSIIVQSGVNKPSVISIRIEKPHPLLITKILGELLPIIEGSLVKGCIVSVDDNQFRIRELPVNK